MHYIESMERFHVTAHMFMTKAWADGRGPLIIVGQAAKTKRIFVFLGSDDSFVSSV